MLQLALYTGAGSPSGHLLPPLCLILTVCCTVCTQHINDKTVQFGENFMKMEQKVTVIEAIPVVLGNKGKSIYFREKREQMSINEGNRETKMILGNRERKKSRF